MALLEKTSLTQKLVAPSIDANWRNCDKDLFQFDQRKRSSDLRTSHYGRLESTTRARKRSCKEKQNAEQLVAAEKK
jgi:hypothetical protein